MAMTVPEAVAFYEERMEETLEAAAAAKALGDFYHAAEMQEQFLKNGLIAGLNRWRHSLGDPRVPFDRAVAGSQQFMAELAKLDPSQTPWKHHRFELADYLRVLIGKPVETQRLRECLGNPLPGRKEMARMLLEERLLDMAVLLRLLTGECWTMWDQLLQQHAEKKRLKLLVATYQSYWDLLTALEARDTARATQLAEQLAGLYLQRENNGYYSGGVEYEGGGPDNPHAVDFRLAAILKSYAERSVSLMLPEGFIHSWRRHNA